jgi:hypothetical protein
MQRAQVPAFVCDSAHFLHTFDDTAVDSAIQMWQSNSPSLPQWTQEDGNTRFRAYDVKPLKVAIITGENSWRARYLQGGAAIE